MWGRGGVGRSERVGRKRLGEGGPEGLCKDPCLPPSLGIYLGNAVPGLPNPQSQGSRVLAGWQAERRSPAEAPPVQGRACSLAWPGSGCCDLVISKTSASF